MEGTKNKNTDDFSLETMEVRGQWNSIILVLRRKVETVSSGGGETN